MPWHPAQKITRADTRTTPASQVGLLQYSLQISLGTLLYSGYSGLMVYQRTYKFAHVFTKPSNIIQFSIRKFRTKMPGRQPGNGGRSGGGSGAPSTGSGGGGGGGGVPYSKPFLGAAWLNWLNRLDTPRCSPGFEVYHSLGTRCQ